jgi:hypothetical protein
MIDVAGNQAPDGIVGPYREREGSFYTVKELWSPILIGESSIAISGSGTSWNVEVGLNNNYGFTDANQCSFDWQFRRFRKPDGTVSPYTVLGEGTAKSLSVPPGAEGRLSFEAQGIPVGTADALSIRVKDPTGRELWTRVFSLIGARTLINTTNSAAPGHSAKISESGDIIEVMSGDLLLRFSKVSATLQSVERGAQVFSFGNGPRLASGEARLATLDTKQDGSDVVINATYTGDLKSVTWRVRGNGWVQCDYTYTANGPKDYHGVTFDYPENLVKKKRWLGDGPYRVWKNRMRGVTLGVWENDYNNTITGWTEWKYPEFKGCFANVRWMQLETLEGPITAVLGQDDLFVQVLKPELPPQNLLLRSAVNLPQAGLAFLHAIPPIGNKFSSAAQTGPQGQPNMASGDYSGSVSLYFGKLP